MNRRRPNRWYDTWWLEDLAVRISGAAEVTTGGYWRYSPNDRQWFPIWVWYLQNPIARSVVLAEHLDKGKWECK